MTKEELISHLHELLDESLESVMERERTTFDRLAGENCNELILYGTGKLGRRTLLGLRQLGILPLAFCDKNSMAWGVEIEGLKVISPEEAVETYGATATFVVTIWNDRFGHPFNEVTNDLNIWGDAKVVSFLPLYWKYPKQFLPYFSLDLPSKIIANRENIIKSAYLIADKESRIEFSKNIESRLNNSLHLLSSPIDKKTQFKNSFLKPNPEEIFIDAGAYNGDTIIELLNSPRFQFKEIIAIEPDPNNFKELSNYINNLEYELKERIHPLQFALGNQNGEISFTGTGTEQAHISTTGDISIKCTRLDDLLKDKQATLIKMDIEGSEYEAILGAAEIIDKYQPVLAISSYHEITHLWNLALLINKLNDKYFYIYRPHSAGGWDYILYAVPQNRLISKNLE
jgi:FkbM family methyltransferase